MALSVLQSITPLSSLLCLLVSLSLQPSLSADENPEISSMLARHMDAVGGQEALSKVRSLRRSAKVSGKVDTNEILGEQTDVYDFANFRSYSVLKLPGYESTSVWNKTAGWKKDSVAGMQPLDAISTKAAQLLFGPQPLVVMGKTKPSTLTKVKRTEFNAAKCIEIGNKTISFYLREDTMLLEGVSIPDLLTITYGDYDRIQGVQLPNREKVEVPSARTELVLTFEESKINEQVDASFFDQERGAASELTGPTDSRSQTSKTTVASLLKEMDRDGDARISKTEAVEDLRLYFSRFDRNTDGWIDADEAEAVALAANRVVSKSGAETSEAGNAAGKITAKQLVSYMDKDFDGKISKAEATPEVKENFGYIDTNSDGFIDVREAQVMADYANKK